MVNYQHMSAKHTSLNQRLEPSDTNMTHVYLAEVPAQGTANARVGVYRIDGPEPIFDITVTPPSSDDLLNYASMPLIDRKTKTYELIFSCQNFDTKPIQVTITWRGGQHPMFSE